jgi:hypothetical protein
MVPRCQVPEEGRHDAETCRKDAQFFICSDREINGILSIAFSQLNYSTISFQASDDYDLSFVAEALREIEYSDTPNHDIDLLKDVAAQAYVG